MPLELAQDTLDNLTDEERAAINDTPSDAELALLKAVAAGDDDDEDDEDAAAAAPAAAPAAPAPAPAAAASASAAAAPAQAPAAAEPAPAPAPAAAAPAPVGPPPAPTYQAKLPDDFETRKTAADAKETDAWTKFKAGELDQAALQAELAAVSAERAALTKLETKAEISTEMTAQTSEQQWQHAVTSFMDGVKGVVDYTKDEARSADLDLFVRALATDPKNAAQPMTWFLDEAHKRVLAMHGLTAAPAPAPAPTPAPAAAAPAARKPDTSNLPPTLAGVPGSDGPGDVSGEFSDIDKLTGFALEDAIRKMTAEQRERYSRGQ